MDQPHSLPQKAGYAAEAANFFMCERCGQYVDRRRDQDVRHHQRLSHRPLGGD